MKKFSWVVSFIATVVIYFALGFQAYAAPTSICPSGQFGELCKLQLNSGGSIVGNIVTILLILAVILCLIFLVLGAIRWITSGGDKAKVDAARGAITASLVGLIIAFLAYFFLSVILIIFTKKSITTFNVPTIVP